MSKFAEMCHQLGGCQRKALVFDAKHEYMKKTVSSTKGGGVKCVSSTGVCVNDKGVSTTRGCQRQVGVYVLCGKPPPTVNTSCPKSNFYILKIINSLSKLTMSANTSDVDRRSRNSGGAERGPERGRDNGWSSVFRELEEQDCPPRTGSRPIFFLAEGQSSTWGGCPGFEDRALISPPLV